MSLKEYVKKHGYKQALYNLIQHQNTEDAMTLAQCIVGNIYFTSDEDEEAFEQMVINDIMEITDD